MRTQFNTALLAYASVTAITVGLTAGAKAEPTVGVVASPTVVSEGTTLTFDFTLSEPAPEGGLPVRLSLYRDTDPAPGDIRYNIGGSEHIASFDLIRDEAGLITNAVVTIAGGATEATMLSTINADGVEEPEERVVFELAVAPGYAIDEEAHAAAFTITDFPVVSLTSEPANVPEGSNLTFTFALSKASETDLPVRLSLLRDTDPLPGDIRYNTEESQNIEGFTLVRDANNVITDAVVTIAAGATEAVMVSAINADGETEGDESVTFGIAVGAGYGIDPDHNLAKFTIKE